MFLKRMDLVGFKSFAERISIDFVSGMTSVVGPNGSGKSNIIDGLRWVLGEQSAKSLRGSKMEDVIFSGSKTRKRLNFAEVVLTLDNSDNYLPVTYQEVTISRRVYRTQESEYQINRVPCRLKDIVDLFMDSGLGREAFSIIGQGKIDEILSSKAEDRRVVFEEAAGVLKYKLRKKKAEDKLADTLDNLLRIDDIITELKKQCEPLAKQAEVATAYLAKKTYLFKREVSYLVYEIEQFHKEWTLLKERLLEAKNEETDLVTKITTVENALLSVREKELKLDDEVMLLQEKFTTLSEEVERFEGQKLVFVEKKTNNCQKREKLQTEIKQAQNELFNLAAQLNSLSEKKSQCELELLEIDNKILKQRKLRLTNSTSLINEKIADKKTELIEILNKKAANENELELLNAGLEKDANKFFRLQSELSILQDDVAKITSEIAEEKEHEQKLVEAFKKNNELLSAQTMTTKALANEIYALENKYRTQDALVQKIASKKDAITELTDDYQGFYQGVREVLKAKSKSLFGVRGAVAECLRIPEKYTTAVEISLGSGAQNIIVEDESAARQAIEFLKKNKFGRATFLPMTVLKGRYLDPNIKAKLKKNSSYLGVGANLIEYDLEYKEIVYNLLGQVVFASDLKGANELAKLCNYRYKIATLLGDIVNPGGSMTGGASQKVTSSFFLRKKQLEKLSEELAVANANLDNTKKELESKKLAHFSADEKLKGITVLANNYQKQILESCNKLDLLRVSLKNAKDKLTVFEYEKRLFLEEKSVREKRIAELAISLKSFNEITLKLEKNISDLDKSLQVTLSDELKFSDILSELSVLQAKKSEQLAYLSQDFTRQKLLESKRFEQLEGLKFELGKLEEESVTDVDWEQVIATQRSARDNCREELADLRNIRTNLQIRQGDIEAELKGLKRSLRVVSSTIKESEISKARVDTELDHRIMELSEKHQLTFEAAKIDFPLEGDAKELNQEILDLRSQILSMGEVNTGAIEEYNRILERLSFLQMQKTDLEAGRQTLLEIISEMDKEMVRRFSTTFTQIQKEFGEIFPQLFGGGTAELKLTKPNDWLSTGIEIIAEPPGKKLQQLSLLSGGERALTAITLLCSILKVRPVPFCVLDEVEAALDEANVERFAEYIKQFSKQTQFVIITHRKGTMKEADVLYGVVMQESGVSRLVSVRLADDDINKYIQ